MRRTALVLIALLLLSACKRGGLTIYAPAELAQGTIFVDGKQAGHFEKTQRLYRWLGWSKMKKELSAPPRSDTIAVLPAVAPGRHELRIEKAAYEPIVTTFDYPGKPVEIDIEAALLKPMNGRATSASPQP
jgi:hypothetical protein